MATLKLGELLVQQAKLRPEQLRQGLALQQRLGGRLGTNLLEAGLIREEALLGVLGEQRSTRTANHTDLANVPPEVLRQLPAKLAGRYRLVPYRLQGKTLFVASMDIGDALIEDEIRMLTGTMVRTTLALELRVREALLRYYRVPCQDRFRVLARRLAGGGVVEPARRDAVEPAKTPVSAPPVRPRPAAKLAPKPHPKPKANDSQVLFIELDAEDEAALRAGRSDTPSGELDALAGPPSVSGQVSPAATALRPVPELEIPELEQALPTEGSETEDPRRGKQRAAPAVIAGLPMEIPEPDLRDPDLSLEHRLDLAAAALQEAEIRDEIADVLLGFCAPYLSRRMLLIHRQERIIGWRGEGDRVRKEAVRAISIDHKEPSVFLSVNSPEGFWLGPLPPLEPNQRLVAGLGGDAPKGCLVLPVVLRSKVVCYLYGDNRQRGVARAPMAELRRLVAKAGIAFEVYILKNKLRLV